MVSKDRDTHENTSTMEFTNFLPFFRVKYRLSSHIVRTVISYTRFNREEERARKRSVSMVGGQHKAVKDEGSVGGGERKEKKH